MPSGKRTKAQSVSKPQATIEYTPWDIVNILGYALGSERSVIDYAARANSHYNFSYCEGVSVLRSLRKSCIVRRYVMEHYASIEEEWQERGKLRTPQGLPQECRRLFADKASQAKDPEELLYSLQHRIEKLLPKFCLELPPWFRPGRLLEEQFQLPDFDVDTTLAAWCAQTIQTLGERPYMKDYAKLSSRVLRDDRDLIEELFELKGLPINYVHFPYSRHKSNRTSHLERLQKFCESHAPVVVEIDTENVEVAPVIAFLQRLEAVSPKAVAAVNIYLTGMEGRPWRHISEFISSPVNYKEVTRIRSQKSVLDTAIIASVLKARYEGGANGVLLVSSDCDFLVLNQQIPDFPVCYCCFHKQTSVAAMKYLRENDLPAVYIDYVVNDVMSERAGQDFVQQHITKAIATSIPNLRNIVQGAALEVCTNSGLMRYSGSVDTLLDAICLGVNSDGTVTATIKEEKVGEL